MRFGLIHRIMTNLLATLGILALVTSGELGRATSTFILLGLAVAIVLPERWQTHPAANRVATIAPLLVLALQIGRLAWGAPLLEVTVEFAIVLQIVRLATRRGAAQDQQVIVLAWLHLIAGTVLGGGLAYAICFVAFLVIAPGALVLSHLRREVEGNYRQGARDRTGLPVDVPRILRSRRVIGKTFLALTCLLSVPIFLFTAVVFVAFPRVGLSLLLLNRPTSGRMVGFSDHVDLGGVGTLRTDPTIVIRVEIPDLPAPPPDRIALYLRGTALDAYDGSAWTRSRVARVSAERLGNMVPILRYPSPAMDRAIKLDLEPIDPPVLFLPPNTAAIQVRPRGEPLFGSKIEVLRGSEDELRYLSPDNRGISYEAFLIEPHERFVHALPVEAREAYLALPDMPPRIAALALEWTEGAGSPMAKAKAIEARLKQDYSYDLNSPSGASRDPLDHFLFESRRGHCEYFSTAMAVLLRHVGVPTRNVTGFVGGTYNRFGSYYSIRQGDAHSWVEAYIDGDGWTRFDPTPPSGAQSLMATTGLVATLRDMLEAMGKTWDRRVVRYDLQQQIWLFSGLRSQFMQTRRSIGSVAVELGSKPRGSLAVGAALIVAIGGGVVAFVLWRRRRTRGEGKGAPSKQGLGPEAKLATELYQRLQKEMAVVGVPRSPGTPPLRHAQKLLEDKHPCAEAVHEVTCAYLRARFGDEPLDSAQREQLEALIRTVRTSVAASKAAR
jgi:transglutaminase-like putative cysteine protease